MNENLRQCDIIGGIFYKSDLTKGKRGYESFVGQYLNIEMRKNTMESIKKRNLWLMIIPYIFLLIAIILFVIVVVVSSSNEANEQIVYVGLVAMLFSNTFGIMEIINTIFFMKDKNMVSTVGDPEAVLRETNGTIDFNSGTIYARTKDYEVYSGNQWVSIFGNILKFIFSFILLSLFGWLVYIIYRIRLNQVSKKFNDIENQRKQYSSMQLSSMLICCSDSDLVEDCTLFFDDGKHLIDKVNYIGTFYYKNVIYAAFEDEEDYPIIVQLEEGFNHFIVEDTEKIKRLVEIYNNLVES